MVFQRLIMGTAVFVALAVPALAKTSGPTLRDRRQAACYGDVQRLCADAMPDVDRVTACMRPKKALVSAKCRALWNVRG